jgi:hypothetical protein
MERESASLVREFKVAEQTHGAGYLDLALAVGYVSKLPAQQPKGGRHLAKHFQKLLFELLKITEAEATAAYGLPCRI